MAKAWTQRTTSEDQQPTPRPCHRCRHKTHEHSRRRYVRFVLSALISLTLLRDLLFHQYLPDSIACRLYIITVLVETTVDLAVEGDLLLRVHQAGEIDESSANQISGLAIKMPVYLGIFALAQYARFPPCFNTCI